MHDTKLYIDTKYREMYVIHIFIYLYLYLCIKHPYIYLYFRN